jgi:hypothetical protein
MARALAGFVSAFALLWVGLAGGVWWEHRPAGWPDWRLGVGPFHWTLRLPDSLQARLDALQRAQADAARRAVAVARAQDRVAAGVGLRQRQEVERIRVQTRTLIERIPVYVTPETDARFPLSDRLVRLHDAAARGVELPAVADPAAGALDPAPDVSASDLAAAVAANYGACRADGTELAGWQGFWREVEAARAAATP